MKAKITLLFAALTLFVSCDKSKLFSQFDAFGESNRWQKADAKVYEFAVDDDSQSFDLSFRFSHVYDYQFDSVPINFTIENPNGEKENFSIDLAIKDSSGKEIAECAGDVCDLKFKIKEKIKLAKGNYKVTISQNFNGPYLPNVIGIGLDVNSVK